MAKSPQSSNGRYQDIAEQLGQRFRQRKLSELKDGVSERQRRPVFTIGFDGVLTDAWKSDAAGLINKLVDGHSFHGVSGGRAGVQDVAGEKWEHGLAEAHELLQRFGRVVRRDGMPLNNCGEAKVLQKVCARKQADCHLYDPSRFVICSFRVYSGSKLKVADPCANCQTWVRRVFGRVIC